MLFINQNFNNEFEILMQQYYYARKRKIHYIQDCLVDSKSVVSRARLMACNDELLKAHEAISKALTRDIFSLNCAVTELT